MYFELFNRNVYILKLKSSSVRWKTILLTKRNKKYINNYENQQ